MERNGSVEIVTDREQLRKYGDNKFPKEWDMFCSFNAASDRKNISIRKYSAKL